MPHAKLNGCDMTRMKFDIIHIMNKKGIGDETAKNDQVSGTELTSHLACMMYSR